MNNYFKMLFGAFVLTISLSAYALPMLGTFSGTVSRSSTTAISGGGYQPTAYDTLLGQSVSGTFSFDTDNVPADVLSSTSQAEFKLDGSIDWFDMIMNLNGTNLDGNQYDNGLRTWGNWDRMFLNDGDLIGVNTDQYFVQESGTYFLQDGGTRTLDQHSQSIDINDSTNILTYLSLDPGQMFEISDFTGVDVAMGSYFTRSHTQDVATGYYAGAGITSFDFDLTYLSVVSVTGDGDDDDSTGGDDEGSVSVPEPSIIALFGTGLVGLGFARRRKSRQA